MIKELCERYLPEQVESLVANSQEQKETLEHYQGILQAIEDDMVIWYTG